MANPKNNEQVAMLSQRLENTSTVLLTEYRGLTVKQITALRKALGSDAAYVVAKNTLVKRAAREQGIEGLDELLTGPTAVTFVSGEAVDAAKALKEFSKENKALVIKGGYMDGTVLSAAQVEAIADMDNRETTLAKLAGALKGSLTKAACLFNAPATKAARLAVALQEKKQDEA